MTRALIFHVGDFKTGSTSIQAVLDGGRVRPVAGRLLYPGRVDHRPLAQTLGDPAQTPHRAARWRTLAQTLDATPWDTAVVSSEQFELYRPEALQAALAEFLPEHLPHLRVVMYLRPHGGRLVGNWAEWLKQGFIDGPLEEAHARMTTRGALAMAPRVARWRAVFGDRLVVRPMIRDALRGGDVVTDFLHVALGGAAYDLDPLAPRNATLSMPDLSLMREVHQVLRARDPALAGPGAGFAWQFARFLSAQPDSAAAARPALHRALAERLLTEMAADAAVLDADVFDRALFAPALVAGVEAAVDHPQPVAAAAWHGPQTIRQVRAWAGMLATLLLQDPGAILSALEPPPEAD